MKIHLCGAAGEVTGSGYLVETDRARVLVDFGMFQGRGATEERNADLGPVEPARVDAVVLTHAHLDHCGRLPLLTAGGFAGKVHATPPTVDFARLILEDSARIQESDAERENRKLERDGEEPIAKPLYAAEDAQAVLNRFEALDYDEWRDVAPGISVRFVDAGHIPGSASVEMRIRDAQGERTVGFSGDIGPTGAPFLRDPVPLPACDLLFLESTYGNRDHRPYDETVDEFQSIVKQCVWDNHKVLIPSFAVGRSQQMLYILAEMIREQQVPDFPIYLDSPMAIRATELYRKHQGIFDKEATELMRTRQLRADLRNLHPTLTSAESIALNELWKGCVIIAGSGMCDGGRIIHHLRHNLWRRGTSVVIVGYMGRGTLGRALIDGAEHVRIFGRKIDVRANIHTLGGFSAHAGQTELVGWATAVADASRADAGSPPRIVLTHGEDPQREALAALLASRFGVNAQLPQRGAVIEAS